ncbi:MAG: TIGR04053 family radical SAM/SPASM domain-containing protein [Armatimonadetes bacterium]|nr:TIGR04053 family radical SAM/SPASM domain-containing protein [Armatimonadota bacterium]
MNQPESRFSASIAQNERRESPFHVDFRQAPFVAIWEVTRACNLACIHCRASAQPKRNPLELTTEEGFALLDEIKRFGDPLFVITGGDPMKRPDLLDLVNHATHIGLRTALTPSGTPLVKSHHIQALKEAGLKRLAISLDGPNADSHDRFRRVPKSFEWTMGIVRLADEAGIPIQINTTIHRFNVDMLDQMHETVAGLPGMALWSVFFLVPTGRGRLEDEISAEEFEQVFNRLYDFSRQAPFDIKTTAAPHYRRVVIQRGGSRVLGAIPQDSDIARAPKGVTDGCGFVFISHIGEVFPSGFLPIDCGNVRTASLVDIYRNHPIMIDLRSPDRYKGKCGYCEFRYVCGGSRARAYSVTGDYMESDPFCVYQPNRKEHAA